MERTVLVRGAVLAAVYSALSFSAPGAEEIPHHGIPVNSEGSAYDCLSCHDGQLAAAIKLSTKTGIYFCNHPVNRDYPPAGKADSYFPVEQVAGAGIKLLNGQITCISCHNLKNPEKSQLAGPLDKSDLCFICHKI